MPWNPEQNVYTLYLERHGKKLKIRPQIQVRTPAGETYLEMLGGPLAFANIEFDTFEVIDPPGTRRGAEAGELSLNKVGMQGTNWKRTNL